VWFVSCSLKTVILGETFFYRVTDLCCLLTQYFIDQDPFIDL